MTDERFDPGQVEEPAESAELTAAQRFDNAIKIFDGEKIEPTETQPEAQQEPEQEPEQKEEKLNKTEYYARMVEKDKEIRQLKSKLKELESGNTTDVRRLAQENPLKALDELGIGLEQILDAWVNDGSQTAEPANNFANKGDEVESIRRELEEFKQSQQQHQIQAQMNAEFNKIHEVASQNPEKWELVGALKDNGSYQLVFDTAVEMYKLNQEVPSYTDVLDAVEQHLEETYSQEFDRFQQLNKFKNRFNIQQERQQAQERQQVKPIESYNPAPQPTLASSFSSDTPLPRSLNEDERFDRALKLLDEKGD